MSVGGFVPKPHTPFQWFGQNGVDELRRKIGLLRDATKGTQRPGEVARSRGDVRRGHREPRRPAHRPGHRARLARGRHVPGVERALRARPLDRRDGGRGPRPRLVRDPAPHPRRGAALGPHRRRASTTTSSGRTGRRRWPSTGSPIAGGRRATTAGCAPTTPSSTWWPRRSPPAGGSQGTGQDLERRGAGASRSASSSTRSGRSAVRVRGDAGSRCGSGTRSGARSAGSRTATSPGRSSGRSASPQLPLAFTEGFSPRPKVSFGLALSTGHESDAEYLDLVFVRRGRARAAAGVAHRGAARRHGCRRRRPRSSSGRRRCKKR